MTCIHVIVLFICNRAPSGKIMLRSGRVITRHEKKFALTCPHGRRGNVVAEGNLIGAAAFTLSGLVVGTIDSVVSGCFGLKFARHSSFFLDELNRMVHKELKKVVVSVKTNQNLLSTF